MARFTKNNKRNPLERTSSQGLVLGCPICAAKLDLLDTRDGDQAYWCHHCQSGWRAGNLPEAAHRSKDSAIPEFPIEATPPIVEARVTGKARVSKAECDAAASASSAPRSDAKSLTAQSQKQLASRPCVQGTLASLTRPSGRYRARGEAKKQSPASPRVGAKPLAVEVIAPKRRAASRVTVSEPKAVAVKPAAPRKSALPRAADIAVNAPKTAAPKNVVERTQKKPILETSPKNSRRAAQTVAPISKPVKTKRQPLEVIATPVRPPRTGVQKRKTLEIAASTPQPKRAKRQPLEIAAPIKALTPRAKRSAPESVMSGKGSRKLVAPIPKAPTGKRQPLEVAAKPKSSAPRATAQKPSKKTLEIAVPIKAVRTKLPRREKPMLETSKGSRKTVQIAASPPKAVTGKRQKPEVAAPKVSARATPQKSQKKILEIAAPIKAPRAKPSRHDKPALETSRGTRKAGQMAAPSPKEAIGKRQNLEVAAPKIGRAQAVPRQPRKKILEIAAPVKPSRRNKPILEIAAVAPQKTHQRKPTLEPTPKPRRAARGAAQPTPAPVKLRTPRVPPVAVVPVRPKPARSSPARPVPVAPSNPVHFGLFDALPAKTAPRRSAK